MGLVPFGGGGGAAVLDYSVGNVFDVGGAELAERLPAEKGYRIFFDG